jgi:uncharacterized integral membrane protein
MRLARRLFAFLVFVGVLVGGWHFAAHNSELVTVYHPGGEFGEVTLWKALLIAFSSGAAIVAIHGLVREARIRLVSRRYRKAIVGLEAEVHQLRSLPISDSAVSSQSVRGAGDGLERGS